jgi:hypothetical protein
MAIVPLEDIETIELLEDRFDLEDARTILTEESGTVSWEAVKKQLNL